MSIANLPSGYRQVEYIQSSGTQYVDTGFQPNGNTRVICDFQITKEYDSSRAIFGARTSGTSQVYVLFHIGTNSFRNDYYGNIETIAVTNELARMTVDKNKNVTTLDGNTQTYTAVTTSTPYNLFLFACNYTGEVRYLAYVKIYSCQIYDNGTLVRNFVPCINPSSVVGLYDTVNAKFYDNSGTGVFTAGRKVYKESEVAKLEYIESDGSQYVDTEFKPNQDSRVVMEAQPTNVVSNGYHCIFGCRGDGLLFELYKASAGSWNLTFLYGSKYTNYFTIDWSAKHTFEINKNVATVDGVSKTETTSAFQLAYNLYLGVDNNGGTPNGFTPMKIYSCQIYDNGALTRDYYPAEIEGEIGLWDAISGVLYTDGAGGTFIAGPYLAVDTPANFEQILAVYLRWEAVDCEAYKIYRNGSLIGTTTDTFYVDITAEQNTEYTYTLIAYRGATESDPTELTVYTRSGYFVIKPLIESAFFQ